MVTLHLPFDPSLCFHCKIWSSFSLQQGPFSLSTEGASSASVRSCVCPFAQVAFPPESNENVLCTSSEQFAHRIETDCSLISPSLSPHLSVLCALGFLNLEGQDDGSLAASGRGLASYILVCDYRRVWGPSPQSPAYA